MMMESKETPPPLDIPKELFQLVDRIKRYGLETVRERKKGVGEIVSSVISNTLYW